MQQIVNLEWTMCTIFVNFYYKIFRSVDKINFNEIASNITINKYDDLTVEYDVIYYYQIKVYDILTSKEYFWASGISDKIYSLFEKNKIYIETLCQQSFNLKAMEIRKYNISKKTFIFNLNERLAKLEYIKHNDILLTLDDYILTKNNSQLIFKVALNIGWQNLEIQGQWGWETIPAPIEEAINLLNKKNLYEQNNEIDFENSPFQQEKIGDYSYALKNKDDDIIFIKIKTLINPYVKIASVGII